MNVQAKENQEKLLKLLGLKVGDVLTFRKVDKENIKITLTLTYLGKSLYKGSGVTEYYLVDKDNIGYSLFMLIDPELLWSKEKQGLPMKKGEMTCGKIKCEKCPFMYMHCVGSFDDTLYTIQEKMKSKYEWIDNRLISDDLNTLITNGEQYNDLLEDYEEEDDE